MGVKLLYIEISVDQCRLKNRNLPASLKERGGVGMGKLVENVSRLGLREMRDLHAKGI